MSQYDASRRPDDSFTCINIFISTLSAHIRRRLQHMFRLSDHCSGDVHARPPKRRGDMLKLARWLSTARKNCFKSSFQELSVLPGERRMPYLRRVWFAR